MNQTLGILMAICLWLFAITSAAAADSNGWAKTFAHKHSANSEWLSIVQNENDYSYLMDALTASFDSNNKILFIGYLREYYQKGSEGYNLLLERDFLCDNSNLQPFTIEVNADIGMELSTIGSSENLIEDLEDSDPSDCFLFIVQLGHGNVVWKVDEPPALRLYGEIISTMRVLTPIDPRSF